MSPREFARSLAGRLWVRKSGTEQFPLFSIIGNTEVDDWDPMTDFAVVSLVERLERCAIMLSVGRGSKPVEGGEEDAARHRVPQDARYPISFRARGMEDPRHGIVALEGVPKGVEGCIGERVIARYEAPRLGIIRSKARQ